MVFGRQLDYEDYEDEDEDGAAEELESEGSEDGELNNAVRDMKVSEAPKPVPVSA